MLRIAYVEDILGHFSQRSQPAKLSKSECGIRVGNTQQLSKNFESRDSKIRKLEQDAVKVT